MSLELIPFYFVHFYIISAVVSSYSKNHEQQDQELVARVKRGDKSAFDLLVIKYQHKIVQLVNRYIKDPTEAQDLAQEAFIKAFKSIDGFRGESAFYTWLYRIAINTAKNELVAKSRKGSEYSTDTEEAENLLETTPAFQDLGTPESDLLNQEILAAIKRTIDNLPEEMRIAIMLCEFDGLSYEEIAKVMDCPIGTVRSRIFRAREAIDHVLNPLLTHGDLR